MLAIKIVLFEWNQQRILVTLMNNTSIEIELAFWNVFESADCVANNLGTTNTFQHLNDWR